MGDRLAKPVRLNVIEELMFWDDRPAYPWSFFVRLKFEGVIDRPTLGKALAKIIQRHPLLQSTVIQKGKRLFFVRQKDAVPEVVWSKDPPSEQLPHSRYLDITRTLD